MGHQRSQGKGWIKLKASPGIPLPEDLQDQNGRLLRLEEFPALLGLLCFSCWEYCINLSLSFSKSHTFLKSLLGPSRLWWSLRLETMTNGVSLTDKWENGCLKWPWTPPNSSVCTVFFWGVGQGFSGLDSAIRLERLEFCCVGGECSLGSRRSRPSAAELFGLGELLKAGFIG